MDDKIGLLGAIGEFIKNLTGKSVVLGTLTGFLGLCLYSLYENRAIAFPYLIAKPYLLLGLGAAVILVIAGVVVQKALARLEEYMQSRIDDQAKLIATLQADLEHCKTDCRDLNQGMLKQIMEKLDGIRSPSN